MLASGFKGSLYITKLVSFWLLKANTTTTCLEPRLWYFSSLCRHWAGMFKQKPLASSTYATIIQCSYMYIKYQHWLGLKTSKTGDKAFVLWVMALRHECYTISIDHVHVTLVNNVNVDNCQYFGVPSLAFVNNSDCIWNFTMAAKCFSVSVVVCHIYRLCYWSSDCFPNMRCTCQFIQSDTSLFEWDTQTTSSRCCIHGSSNTSDSL